MTHWLMRRIKRKHNALWVDVRWLEPFGAETWAVCVEGFPEPAAHYRSELSRSRSLFVALWRALFQEARTWN